VTKVKSKAAMTSIGQSDAQAADAFMASLEHPLKAEIDEIQAFIRRVNTSITKNVTWNAEICLQGRLRHPHIASKTGLPSGLPHRREAEGKENRNR
jgi:hypothetical protein